MCFKPALKPRMPRTTTRTPSVQKKGGLDTKFYVRVKDARRKEKIAWSK